MGDENENVVPPPAPPAVDYAALFKQQQEANQAMQQQMQQLFAKNLELMEQQKNNQQSQQQVAQPDIFANTTPETKELLTAFEKTIQEKFKKELAATQQTAVQANLQLALNQIDTNPTLPANLRDRAKQIYHAMTQKGIPFNTDDAVQWTIGEAVKAGTYQPVNRNVPPPPSVINGGSPQPSKNKKIPANIDQMHWSEQIVAYEAAGIADEQF